jgi:hypothetical protein
MEFFHDFGWFC